MVVHLNDAAVHFLIARYGREGSRHHPPWRKSVYKLWTKTTAIKQRVQIVWEGAIVNRLFIGVK